MSKLDSRFYDSVQLLNMARELTELINSSAQAYKKYGVGEGDADRMAEIRESVIEDIVELIGYSDEEGFV